MATNLELVDTPELLQELLSRFNNAVFMGMKYGNDKKTYSYFQWTGQDKFAALGLVEMVKTQIIDQIRADSHRVDPDSH